ncbi:MAG: hypothetical protein WBA41_24310 [Rivularia sp. (in: cyanobacteria)]
MISLLFDCSAFEISATVQTINDIFFPVFLFAIIFWLMCEILIADVNESNETIKTQANEPNVDNSLLGMKTDNYKTVMEFPNIDRKGQNLQVCG